ncbi:uncharacterized protein VNE69_02210 [Vairimorpha necatrix]|uniref:Uncharacterized protein n=1 Tax=Vairimorpha necatrix TaxID=6039 RepID=A0AAX4J9Q4_9MICR
MMFLNTALVFLNLKRVINNTVTEILTNWTIEGSDQADILYEDRKHCRRVLFQDSTTITYKTYDFLIAELMAKLLYDSILSNMIFPIKSQPNWPGVNKNNRYEM